MGPVGREVGRRVHRASSHRRRACRWPVRGGGGADRFCGPRAASSLAFSIAILAGILAPAPTAAAHAAHASRSTPTAPSTSEQIPELWQDPADIASRDLFHGPGGRDLVPKTDVAYRFKALDTTGHSGGYD